ncbi:acyltransferase [Enterococcus faecium]|nr:acyltransferase [Enterococcus faecium]QCS46855.1 acyltransferase [Enterococcus faecium]RSA50693.1 acyltransferase [Enterococcus faecium]RSA58284.1 acyltransferase [Enterococcus faecium]RSA68153.1 acyltransferase [Enterococcus faecium]
MSSYLELGGYLCPRTLRVFIYRCFGIKVYTNHISPKCFIGGTKLYIGENTFINYNNFFDLTDSITIGKNVFIGCCSQFITSTHRIEGPEQRAGITVPAPIVIEDGSWIGANVTVIPGVTIHKGAIVAAGSVVVKDCEENALYAGVPAKKIRNL